MDEIRNYTMAKFNKFCIKELGGINDIQLLILKGHIIVEYTLNCYLESISKADDSNFFKENFTFAHKINLAKHFGDLSDKESLIKELTLLNKLRNDLSHSLKYNNKHLEGLFSEINKKAQNTGFTKQKTDIEKTKWAIGFISGALFGVYKFHTDRQSLEEFLNKNN